jgi:hypothetical protein
MPRATCRAFESDVRSMSDVTPNIFWHVVDGYDAADGTRHEVAVAIGSGGRWEVLDVVDGRVYLVVETLTGFDDGVPQAESLAYDYARHSRSSRLA